MPIFFDGVHVVNAITDRQDAAKNLWMKCFDSTVKHLGKAGVLGHIDDIDARLLQMLASPTGAVDLHTRALQPSSQIGHTHFVTDADQGTANGDDVGHEGDLGLAEGICALVRHDYHALV